MQAIRAANMSDLVLLTPEALGRPDATFDELLKSLRTALKVGTAALPRDSVGAIPRWALCVAGQAISGDQVIISDAMQGYASPGELSGFGDGIDRLPTYLRAGRGWLINGRRENAPSFRVALVVTDQEPEYGTEVARFSSLGENFLRDLETCGAAGIPNLDRKAPQKPVGLLEGQSLDDARSFLHGIRLLAGLIRLESLSEATELAIEEYLVRNGILKAELSAEVAKFVAEGRSELSAAMTRMFLQHPVAATDAVIDSEFLHWPTLADHLIENGMDPDTTGFAIAPRRAAEIYEGLIKTETDAAGIPVWLDKALRFLFSAQTESRPSLIKGLIQTAFETTEEKGAFEVWFDVETLWNGDGAVKEGLWSHIVTRLLSKSRSSRTDWESVYLRSGLDPGGVRLAEMTPAKEILDPLMERAVSLATSNGPRSSFVGSWVRSLATSPLRLMLSIKQKEGLVFPEWSAFQALKDIVNGNYDGKLAPVSESERAFLRIEALELLKERELHAWDSTKEAQLKDLLGELPEELRANSVSIQAEATVENTFEHLTKRLAETSSLLAEMISRGDLIGSLARSFETKDERLAGFMRALSFDVLCELLDQWRNVRKEEFEATVVRECSLIASDDLPAVRLQILCRYLVSQEIEPFFINSIEAKTGLSRNEVLRRIKSVAQMQIVDTEGNSASDVAMPQPDASGEQAEEVSIVRKYVNRISDFIKR